MANTINHLRGADHPNFRHGHRRLTSSPEYRSWRAMSARCLNPNDPAYLRYGGRGIGVCDRWLTFDNFLADMGERPQGTSLDRADNDAGYSPENCRWASRVEQGRNMRSNRMVTIGAATKCISEWCLEYGITTRSVHLRIQKGWSVIKAITEPKRHRHGGEHAVI